MSEQRTKERVKAHHITDADLTNLPWSIIEKYFSHDEQVLVKHHISSYDLFMREGFPKILRDENPLSLEFKDAESERQNIRSAKILYTCKLFLGGKDGTLIYYGKPIIYDNTNDEDAPIEEADFKHYMYPNEARLRNMTYATTVRVDVLVEMSHPNPEYIDEDTTGDKPKTVSKSFTIPRVYLGRFPIMVQSNLCILKGVAPQARFYMGECRNDHGGYFIIDGKEKVIISQEKFADNLINIRVMGGDDEDAKNSGEVFTHSADIRNISEDPSKPVRTMSVRIVAQTPSHTHGNIVVMIPNVRSPVPLFIVMRALGIESDKEIIEHCVYDLDANSSLTDMFVPSVHDAGRIFTQRQALEFIGMLTKLGNNVNTDKEKTINCAHEILSDYMLPQVGELNYKHKAYMLGYIVNKLIRVAAKIDLPTDRDSFRNKRVEVSGTLLYDLFREYYKIQIKNIRQSIDTTYYYEKTDKYQGENFTDLVSLSNYQMHFKENDLEKGVRRAFKGNWGSTAHTKRIGVVQDLNRLSYNSFISHLRKINLEMAAGANLIKPRLLHSSQWGMIDPVDVPDGANTGLHKHLSMTTHITAGCSAQPMIEWLRDRGNIRFIDECAPRQLFYMTKILVNGTLWGATDTPVELINTFKFHRRIALIPVFISIRWHISSNEIHIFTDAGRLCRPLFYTDRDIVVGGSAGEHGAGKPSYSRMLKDGGDTKWSWESLVSGTADKGDNIQFNYENYNFYTVQELYGDGGAAEKEAVEGGLESETQKMMAKLRDNKAIVEFLDQSETESALIGMSLPDSASSETRKQHKAAAANAKAIRDEDLAELKNMYTHYEIHPSLILGVMGNQISFVENNQFPRDAFGCGQAKQTASLYHTNFFSRIDKMSMVINNGQTPIVKSRYLEYINNEEHPNGENAIVAIMCYNGYNVEDSILFNEGAIKRGLFNITYYNMYEDCEESSPVPAIPGVHTNHTNTRFSDMKNVAAPRGINSDHDYQHLDAHGIIRENVELNDRMVVIGKTRCADDAPDDIYASPVVAKKGQLGYVDRTYMTEGMQGKRIAKVRVREHRYPAVGDKFCSRCGQKGTVGLIIPERDMPFTADGIRPDIIINPHAIPSRMTVGQLIETIMGKACVITGAFGDCTAFVNQGPRHKIFGDILAKNNLHPSGTEILYSGMSGEQIEADIFMGPTYYMRLKQMVKDKINYRRTGPYTELTRQPVQGRANDGGLRVGEMERDSIVSHGTAHFLKESMTTRSEQSSYFVAICNTTGMIAIYNKTQDLFMSPLADGPIKYAGNMQELKSAKVVNITRHGRSFSVVQIPYALKLLIQELQVMNVQMRIITDANVDHIASLAASHNIKRLTMDSNASLVSVTTDTARALGETLKPTSLAPLKLSDDEFGSESDGVAGPGFGGDDYDDDDDDANSNSGMVSLPGEARSKKRAKGKKFADFPDITDMNRDDILIAVEQRGWEWRSELSDKDGDTFASIVTNEHGKPTEFWHTSQNGGKYPNRYPKGWDNSELKWFSSKRLEDADKVAALKLFIEPTRNNMANAYDYLKRFKRDKYPTISEMDSSNIDVPSSSTTAENTSTSKTLAGILSDGASMADVVLSSSPLAVLQARLNNVDKQTMEIEQKLKSIQLNPSGSGPSGGKELSKDDLSQIEAFARTLVEHRSEHDKIVKQMVDERAVKAISDEIVSKSNSPGDYYPRSPQYTSLFDSPGTPASYGSYSPGSYTGYMPQTPPYTAMSPMSPMSPMQVQYVPVVPQAQPAPAQPAPAASASSSSGGDNTKKIILS
jgi:DNA-directed RNA polymerase II subunit RPB2